MCVKNCLKTWKNALPKVWTNWKTCPRILAEGSKNAGSVRIYAIDPHTGSSEHREQLGKVWTFDEFKKNIEGAGAGDMVMPIVKTSEEAAGDFTEPVELLFIDGAHDYETVHGDITGFKPLVKEGGLLCGHDYSRRWPGVVRAVNELVPKRKLARIIWWEEM